MKIKLLVSDFASHVTWAEGYQGQVSQQNKQDASAMVSIVKVPSDRWKWRFMGAAAELLPHIADDDDVVIVDGGLLDVTVLVALLQAQRRQEQTRMPKIILYMHENQLTTPFAPNDRDVKAGTHWHYGVAHWRSLLVADGMVFNSRQHQQVFATALLQMISEQCPRDAVDWHLSQAREALSTKTAVLPYGLELEQLRSLATTLPSSAVSSTSDLSKPTTPLLPVILWNARLEADKDPEAFVQLLECIRHEHQVPFRLIVLGTDPSKDQIWYTRFRRDFPDELLFLGWCTDRDTYAHWLSQARIVVSTARHETFGISMVESMYCGALPLLPQRLSYPEILPSKDFSIHFYTNQTEAVSKLVHLLQLSTEERSQQALRVHAAVAHFDWSIMGRAYNEFWTAISAGEGILRAQAAADSAIEKQRRSCIHQSPLSQSCSPDKVSVIVDASDTRVALYRPKSLRDHKEYQSQLAKCRAEGLAPSLHGGRRAMVRMLEAISMGAQIRVLSFLTTRPLAEQVVVPKLANLVQPIPVWVTESKTLLDEIRGQKLNAGDAILALIYFPVSVASLDALLAKPPILVLENVRNAENIGSILRTAFCLGITSIVASPTAWAALSDSRAARCSMGTIYCKFRMHSFPKNRLFS